MKLRDSNFFLGWMLMAMMFLSCDNGNNLEPPNKNYFVKYFGGDGDQTAADFLVNDDNSIIILGNWALNQVSGNKLYLVKVDQDGNLIWEKKLGEINDFGLDIEFNNDGEILLLCDHIISEENIDVKVILLTDEGVPIDSTTYGTTEIEKSSTVTPLLDGGFIVTGWTAFDTTGVIDPNNPDESDIFHIRWDAGLNFNSTFTSQFGSGKIDHGTKVIQYSPDLFYVFGSTDQIHDANQSGNLNLFYYSIDGGGNNGAPNYLGDYDNNTESVFAMEVPPELGAGYLVTGTHSTSTGLVTMHVAKLRSPLLFNSLSDEHFDRQISFEARKLTMKSAATAVHGGAGYLLVSDEEKEQGSNIFITKIDLNGNWLWSASYGSEEDNDMGVAIAELESGKILVLGSVRLINNQYKMVLMKLNSAGELMN